MVVLGIESSCDDTAAAVLVDGEVRSSVVASQDDVHHRYGGVVPELASRSHLRAIIPVIDRALAVAGKRLDEIDGIAVTVGPGLVGSLLVGLSAAKAIALVRRLPLVGINHLEGHILSPCIEAEVAFPYLVLVVSGGHTSLYWVEEHGRYRCLGKTRDDAAGEAFDKVAKILGLGYPGGQVIDGLSSRGDAHAIRFPRARLKPSSTVSDGRQFDFSFSGLKTAVWQYVRDRQPDGVDPAAVAASFQEAVVDMLLERALAAAGAVGATRLVIAGGVAANSRLRQRAQAAGAESGLTVNMPAPRFCTDNAAMIAYAGSRRLARGQCHPLTINAAADLDL